MSPGSFDFIFSWWIIILRFIMWLAICISSFKIFFFFFCLWAMEIAERSRTVFVHVEDPAPTWSFTTVHNSSSRGWAPPPHLMSVGIACILCTCMQEEKLTNTLKTNIIKTSEKKDCSTFSVNFWIFFRLWITPFFGRTFLKVVSSSILNGIFSSL